MVPTNTEILPENYSDEYGQVSPGIKTEIKGQQLSTSDLLDGVEGVATHTPQVSDNELAARAFELAKEEFGKLPSNKREGTSPGAIGMKIFDDLKRQAAMEAKIATSAAQQPITDSRPKSKMITSTPKSQPKRVVRRKVVKKVAPPTQQEQIETPAPVSNIQVRTKPKAEVPSDPFSGLQIPQLGVEPVHMDIEVGIEWESTGDAGEGLNEETALINCNWAIIDQDDNGNISQVAIIRDKRHKQLDQLPSIPFTDNGTMNVYVAVELPPSDTPDQPSHHAAAQFEAIKGMFTVEFGVFEIVILLATGN